MAKRVPRPALPPGALDDLMCALHELYGEAGWPSVMTIKKSTHFGYSHTVAHRVLSSTTLPNRVQLFQLVSALCEIVRNQGMPLDQESSDHILALWGSAERATRNSSESTVAHDAPGSVSTPDRDGAANRQIEPVDNTPIRRNESSSPGGLIVLAVDDEEAVLDELAYLLGEDMRVEMVLKASDATDALRILNSRQGVREAAPAGQLGRGPGGPMGGTWVPARTAVEVVFLDIRMPGLDGVELARVLSSMASPPSVVFVTAYDDRAVDAFEVGAVDYLLKPLRSERLSASIDRVLARRVFGRVEPAREDEVIPVELAGTTKLVPRSAVRYVEAQGDYTRLHTHEGSHLVRIPLAVLEDRWRDAGFVRIHRSFLVSLPLVTELRMSGPDYMVRIGTGPDRAELPVSRRYTRELKARLRPKPFS